MQRESLDLEKKVPAKKSSGGRTNGRDQGRDMGDALRSVYDRTVKEAVPDDLLDLLSKLD